MVLAQSLFKLLKDGHPGRRLEVLAPPWTLPLLGFMPEVDAALELPIGHGVLALGTRRRIARGLRGRYDWAIILPRSFKSALIPFWAGVPRRTGYLGEARWGLVNHRHRREPRVRTVDGFVRLGLPRHAPPPRLAPPALSVDPAKQAASLAALGLTRPAGRLLALCPGAEYGPAKRWPVEHFAALAGSYLAQGWAVWLFGSPRDREITARIGALAGGGCVDLAGRTDLAQAVALLGLADAVVSNDSGLMHVAAALDRRQIALFGSSDTSVTPPLSARATVLSRQLPCRPCNRRRCPLGHLRCLRGIEPDAVRRALEA